jgi:hypothetical protein
VSPSEKVSAKKVDIDASQSGKWPVPDRRMEP